MTQAYNPKEIEPKWQAFWEREKIFEVKLDKNKPKFYGLIEFPYPSGAGLHVGHPRSYTAMDVITRKKRMEGYNSLFPIGFDAFGLPTENFAIKNGRAPADVTKENIATFTRQLKSLGFGFDWSRAVDTTDPTYYKWTQWIFLQLYKHGLAYKKNQPINWCPKDKIGLANEEVVNGCCERCGTAVEKRDKEQWMLAITKYADSLAEGLRDVDYIERAKIQQENWIGKSEGAEITFVLRVPGQGEKHTVTVFTTRPDTIFGATFLAVAPELAKKWLGVGWQATAEVKQYVDNAIAERVSAREAEPEKTGVNAGIVAVNPVTKEEIPVWVTNYVMGDVGTGAIMAVPAHDERDFEFAKKFNLPIKDVVIPTVIDKTNPPREGKESLFRKAVLVIVHDPKTNKYLCLTWKEQPWITFITGGVEEGEDDVTAARREIAEETGYTDVRLKRVLGGPIESHYFAAHKNINRRSQSQVLLFELASQTQEKVSKTEREQYDITWLSQQEVEKARMQHGDFSIFWQRLNAPDTAFVHEGVLINSDFLNGLTTAEARKSMVAWLEEKGIGKYQVNYKLRDWVFSRQRYWGEPIPLVFCESCAKKKQKILLIHGFEGSAETNWLPWMKRELEAQGFDVFAPTMSTANHPTVESWMQELLPIVEGFSNDDIIVAHSLGSKAALHLLQKSKKKIKALYLVASAIGAIDKRNWDEFRQHWPGSDIDALQKFWQAPVDYSSVNDLVRVVQLIRSSDDPFIPPSTHENLPAGWCVSVWNGFGHFDKQSYPELLEEVLQSKITGWVPLPESQLPLTLPQVEKYQPTDTGESPLAAITDWVNTTCPDCGGTARRETDTMPNWAGSSWYFLRYMDPANDSALASKEALQYWAPVDWYNGGMEHTVLHLLYSRFWNQFLYDIGVVPTREPYKRRTSHGMILAKGGEKMSKSKGNVVNPDEMVEQFGADALRAYILFMGPFDQAVEWDTNGLVGIRRMLDRLWKLQLVVVDTAVPELDQVTHETVKKVGEDIDGMRFNTAVSQVTIWVNEATKHKQVNKEQYEMIVKVFSPLAPHITEELWQILGGKGSVALSSWPAFDATTLVANMVTIAIQINGKLRHTIELPADVSEETATTTALQEEKVQQYTEGLTPKKVIYIKGKLINIVM